MAEIPLGGLGSLFSKSEGLLSAGGVGAAILGDQFITIPENVAADPKLMTVIIIVKYAILAFLIATSIMSYNASRGRAKAGEEGVKK